MSGRKKSNFQLQREREEKLMLVQRVKSLCSQAVALQQEIHQQLSAVSKGLRDTFSGEVARAQNWANQTLPDGQSLGMDSDTAAIRQTQERLEQVTGEGRQVQQQLEVALTQKADDLGRRFAAALAEVRGKYLARRELIGLWLPDAQRRAGDDFALAETMLQDGQYARLETLLEQVHSAAATAAAEAESLEGKHQKRMYLLKALRQVCQDMGMEEITAPQYESPGQRGSRITFKVDTINHGQIAFSLTLDGISSFAGTENQAHCFHDFSTLSRHLHDQFGIQTRFRTETGEELPEDRSRNELDLPEESGLTASG